MDVVLAILGTIPCIHLIVLMLALRHFRVKGETTFCVLNIPAPVLAAKASFIVLL